MPDRLFGHLRGLYPLRWYEATVPGSRGRAVPALFSLPQPDTLGGHLVAAEIGNSPRGILVPRT
jgi:hypothetical protein